jgi:hypothetical protein
VPMHDAGTGRADRATAGETHRDAGADYFINRDPERQTKRLVKQLERLGHHVTLQEGAAAA